MSRLYLFQIMFIYKQRLPLINSVLTSMAGIRTFVR